MEPELRSLPADCVKSAFSLLGMYPTSNWPGCYAARDLFSMLTFFDAMIPVLMIWNCFTELVALVNRSLPLRVGGRKIHMERLDRPKFQS